MTARMRGSQTSEGRLPLSTPHWFTEQAFRPGDVPAVRRFTRAFGARTGIAAARLADFVLAVSEATACTSGVGPCTPRVRLWLTGPRAFCEVRGDGLLLLRSARGTRPYDRPGEEEAMRRRVLKQLSDCVCVASGPDGVRVLLSMRVA